MCGRRGEERRRDKHDVQTADIVWVPSLLRGKPHGDRYPHPSTTHLGDEDSW